VSRANRIGSAGVTTVVLTDQAPALAIDDLAAFVSTHHRRAVRAVTAACGSVEVAEEAVQEALARAWDRRHRHPQPDSMIAWVIAVAINETRSVARRSAREARAYGRAGVVAEAVEPPINVDLRRALDSLPLRQRQVVVLHYLLGFDVASIATTLGISPGTVKSGLSRARHTLANCLNDDGEVSDGR
jgi:RNA polymerase sigma-70 factor (ECF subfamily)